MAIQFGGSIPFVMYLAGTDIPATGKTCAVQIAKEGGPLQAPFGAITELGAGAYRVASNIHDTDTPGCLIITASAAGCDTMTLIYEIAPKVHPQSMRKTESLLTDANDRLQQLIDRNY